MSIITTITGTTEKVTLNSEGLWANPTSLDVTNSTITSESITSSGAATNYVHLYNSGGHVTALTITGNTFFSDDRTDGVFVSQLNSINASTDTGGVDIDTSLGILKSTFTFTGGSGVALLSISKASLDGLNAGSQLNGGLAPSGNVLGIGGLSTLTGTAALSGEYKTLNATKGFQILGIGGTGNNVVINDAFLTNGFANHIVDGQYGGSLTVTNIGKSYILDIFNNGYINPPQVSYNLSSAVATQTALTINLTPNWGPSPAQSPSPLSGLNVGNMTTSGGIKSVALVSNTGTSANTIDTYHGSDGQTLTITGNDAFTIGSLAPNTKTGDTIDASKFTQGLTLGTMGGTNAVATWAGDTGKGDVIKLGAGTSYLAASSVVTGDKITLLSGHTAPDTIDTTLIASAIAATPYTTAAAQKADITQITNFNTNSDILKVGIGGVTLPVNGTSTDLTGHKWTVTNGFVTGTGLTGATGLTAFLADVAASKTFVAHDALAYNDGTNTYIAVGDHAAGTALGENIVELLGVKTATALGSAGGANTIDIAGSTSIGQATLTLNGVGSWGNAAFIDLNDKSVSSETVISTGSVNHARLSNSAGTVTALTINGNTFLDLKLDHALIAQLNSINASADIGGFMIEMNHSTLLSSFTFTGGSGVNFLNISNAYLDVLTSGSQLNGGTATSGNGLFISDIGTLTGTSSSTGEYKTLNATKGFQILGIDNVEGVSTVMINDAFLTNGFATHIIDMQDGGSLTVLNVGSTYTLDIINPGATNNILTDFTIGSAASVKTALTVNLTPNYLFPSQPPTSSAAGLTEGTLTTAGGTVTSVALVSNAAASANTINTYHGSDNQTITITGTNALTIGSIAADIKTGDTINASGFAQTLTLGTTGGANAVATGAGDTGKGDVIKLGSGTSYLAASSAVTGDKITLLSGHTAADTIDTTMIGAAIAATPYTTAAAQKADITQITNFNSKSDILKVGIGGVTLPSNGTSTDLTGHKWTVTNGFVTGTGLTGATGLTAFLADVAASKTFTANDVLAYNDGTNTYIAVGDHAAGTALGEHIMELVGVNAATSMGNTGGATSIDIAGLTLAINKDTTFTLTPGVDSFVGGAGNDTFNAYPVSGNDITLTAKDYLDGGAGINTLNVVQKSAPISIPSSATIKNIQTANLTSASTVSGDVSGWIGLTTLNVNEVGGTFSSSGITAAGTTDVTLTDSALGWHNSITVNGGHNVNISASGVSSMSPIIVGGTSAPTGSVNIIDNMVFSNTTDLTQRYISVEGGIVVRVTETSGTASAPLHNTNYTVTQGEVDITGTATTTSVTVIQDPALTKVDGMSGNVGITDGGVHISDVHSFSQSITTVTLNNFRASGLNDIGAAVYSNALQNLNLSGTGGNMVIGSSTPLPYLNINLNGLIDTGSITVTANLKTLNLDSSTAPSTIHLLEDDVTALNITGNAHLTLSGDANLTDNEVITVTNTAGVTLGSIATPLNTHDLTINLATNISAAQTVYGDAFHHTINQASGANTGLLTISEDYSLGGGDVLSFATTGNQSRYITISGYSDTVTLTGGGSGNTYVGGSLDAITHTPTSKTGPYDTFMLNGSGNDYLWIGRGSTINIGTTFSGTANIKLAGNQSGQLFTVNGLADQIAHWLGATVTLDFTDVALTGGIKLAGSTLLGSMVNETGVTYLGGAMDRAAIYSGQINAHSGVIDWFQFKGDTYIVESVNTGSTAVTHTGLGGDDVVVKLTGLVDLSTANFNAGAFSPLHS